MYSTPLLPRWCGGTGLRGRAWGVIVASFALAIAAAALRRLLPIPHSHVGRHRVGQRGACLAVRCRPLAFFPPSPISVPTPTCWSALVRQRSLCSVVAPPVAVSSPPPPSRRRRFPLHANCGLGSSEWSPQILPSHAPRCIEGSVQRAASRTPARAVGEGRGARPRATDEQLVGVGQGVCALPSRREGIRCGRRCGPGGQEGGGRRWRKQRAGERARLQIRGRARGGAHVEHVAHDRDAGGVEAQRMVERRRGLPRAERTAYGAGRRAGRVAGGGGRPRGT